MIHHLNNSESKNWFFRTLKLTGCFGEIFLHAISEKDFLANYSTGCISKRNY